MTEVNCDSATCQYNKDRVCQKSRVFLLTAARNADEVRACSQYEPKPK